MWLFAKENFELSLFISDIIQHPYELYLRHAILQFPEAIHILSRKHLFKLGPSRLASELDVFLFLAIFLDFDSSVQQ